MVDTVTETGNSRFMGLRLMKLPEVAQMVGEQFLSEIRHPEIDIQLRALMHPPQHYEGPDCHLIGLASSERDQDERGQADRQLVIEARTDGLDKSDASALSIPPHKPVFRGPVR